MPGGKICSITGCKINSKITKRSGQIISFHRFPEDPEICAEWVRKCYRKDKFSPQHKRVCSKHFADKLKEALMGTPPKILKKTGMYMLYS